MKKLKNILIIDDNDATNHFHRRLIEKLYPEINVHLTENGKEGFDYFILQKKNLHSSSSI